MKQLISDVLKKQLKSKEISEDDEKKFEKKIQNITDEHIKKIEEKVITKEKEIMTVWIQYNMSPLLWMVMAVGD